MEKRDVRLSILNAVYDSVAEIGLDNLTTKKISLAAKTSENVIYHYFSGKVQLLETAFNDINCEIDLYMRESFSDTSRSSAITNEVDMALLLWDTYLDYWLTHHKKAIFFNQYIHSTYINNSVWRKQSGMFVFFTQIMSKVTGNLSANYLSVEGRAYVIMLLINSALTLATDSMDTGQALLAEVRGFVAKYISLIINGGESQSK